MGAWFKKHHTNKRSAWPTLVLCFSRLRHGTTPRDVRMLHKRLVAMHFIAIANMSAGCAKYMLDVSERSCLDTRRVMVATILLYDVSFGNVLVLHV